MATEWQKRDGAWTLRVGIVEARVRAEGVDATQVDEAQRTLRMDSGAHALDEVIVLAEQHLLDLADEEIVARVQRLYTALEALLVAQEKVA